MILAVYWLGPLIGSLLAALVLLVGVALVVALAVALVTGRTFVAAVEHVTDRLAAWLEA